MKKNLLAIISLICAMLCVVLLVYMRLDTPELKPAAVVESTDTSEEQPSETQQQTAATPEPTPTPTPEPTPEYFTISVIGDMTLASHQYLTPENPKSYAYRMNGDYSYTFANTIDYFKDDDLTIGNLECTLSDRNLFSYETFYFRSPTEWANILLEGSVEFVTTANNHTNDFGENGANDTYAALEQYGIPYGKENEAQIFTTESGLKVGIYCAFNDFRPDKEKSIAGINKLKADGAEYIICAFHWGQELKYTPRDYQVELAHACIDAGADLIYGSHPHCLEPIEEYGNGLILYSMGNWSFGGNTNPSDWDTALVQVQVKRDVDGRVTTEGFTAVPCCCSESKVRDDNDYKPTPYEEGTEEYARIMSKLDGSYDGPDGNADYSNWYASHS